ncbi:MAG: hypothetical protein JJV88_01540 [Sulfurovum sp.]|nr:hypothetical protein [Sulfurovaceae bacterium]
MSMQKIKVELETYLNNNITDIAIKWSNTSTYSLNSTTLTQDEVNSLNEFLEPFMIAISEDREEMSSSTPFKYKAFFQISIYTRVGTATGKMFATLNRLNKLFKEKNINDVWCERVETLGSFEQGQFLVTPFRIVCSVWSD